MRARARQSQRGFTLIEVLVALAIVAIGMAALLSALSSSADSASYLRDKTFAEWVALNRIEEVRLASAMPQEGKTRRRSRARQPQMEVAAGSAEDRSHRHHARRRAREAERGRRAIQQLVSRK